MRKKQIVLKLLGFFILFVASTTFAFDFSQVENKIVEYTLDNGLKILVLPRHDAPVVSFATQANVGCADDPKGAMGLAHMFEHMAFKGTKEIGTENYKKEKKWMDEEDRIFELILKERSKGDLADSEKLATLEEEMKAATDSASQYIVTNEYSEILASNGGVGLNAGTSFDNTTYYISLPSNRLELWMAMEADRFTSPVLRDLFKEKNVVAEERRFRVESSPFGRVLFNEYPNLLYVSHPYGRPMVGEMNEIHNYNRPVMLEQFERYYVPRNIAIAIVGDVDPEEVHKLAKKYFSKIKDRPKPRPVMINEQESFGFRQSTVYDNSQPMFVTGFHCPSENHPDFRALDALTNYLGSGRTSVLYKKLVKEDKSAVQASTFLGYPGTKYASVFSFLIVPSNESSNTANETEIMKIIDKVKSEPIPEKELEKIKAKAKASFINGLASNMGMANQLVSYQNSTGDWHDLFRELDKVNALTPDDLQRVAKTYLTTENRIAVYVEKPEDTE